MKIGLLVIATNKYTSFVEPLYNSMQKYFFTNTLKKYQTQMFLFTNVDKLNFDGPVLIKQDHYPWPGMTLRRYEMFYKNKDKLKDTNYLFYADVDMLFENFIGEEILGNTVCTLHCGFYNKSRKDFSYESNPKSLAYIPPTEGKYYFAGGFQGGKTSSFLEICKVLSERIIIDLNHSIIAQWHDESHLNKYFSQKDPDVILNPSYCFPEAKWADESPYKAFRKLVALDKNHKEIRK